MPHARPRSAFTLVASALLAPALAAQTVTWKGRDIPAADLASQAPAAATNLAAWAPFVAAAHYRALLADDAQILLLLHSGYARKEAHAERTEAKALLASLHATIERVDAVLGPTDGVLSPAVVVATTEADQPRLFAHIATLDPRLADWTKTASSAMTGFVLSEPLCGAWLDDGKGQEEWDRQNELVHRTAQLLLRRRAAQLPPWFPLGFAWHIEDAVRGGIYCFPHRRGFVWASEHGEWDQRLVAQWKPAKRKAAGLPQELTIEELAGFEPAQADGGFDAEKAYAAFGVARYLAHRHEGSVLRVAHAFDAAIQKGRIVKTSEFDWVGDPSWRLPGADQLAILESIEPRFLTHVTDAFVHGKLGKPRDAKNK